jgi:hypothetical protein
MSRGSICLLTGPDTFHQEVAQSKDEYSNIYIVQDLAQPTAESMKALKELLEGEETGQRPRVRGHLLTCEAACRRRERSQHPRETVQTARKVQQPR